MKPRASLTALLSALSLMMSGTALGQGRPGMPTTAPPTQMGPALGLGTPYASVTIIVADENGANLGEQALVKLYSNTSQTNVWGTTQDRSQVIFNDVPVSDYEVEVSAAGYQTTTKSLNVITAGENYDLIVRLKEDDSGAVTNPIPGQVLAPKARKEVQKGIVALNAGKLSEAQKHLETAYKLAPTNADVTYLMGLLYAKMKDAKQSETYMSKTISINPKHVRALTTLGQLRLQQKDYAGAATPLEQATSLDAGFWMAHWLLAEAYFGEGEFEKSRQQAELAIQKGKGAASGSELVLGEALANLGRREEAIQAFEAFLQQSPGSQRRRRAKSLHYQRLLLR